MKSKPLSELLVLLVDDRPEILMALRMALQSFKLKSCSALGGAAALEAVRETKFDLILLDVDMPDLNGFEVCRRLKQDLSTRGIPVVFVTGRSGMDKKYALKLGAADWLEKPFRLQDLKNCVLRSLSQSGDTFEKAQ